MANAGILQSMIVTLRARMGIRAPAVTPAPDNRFRSHVTRSLQGVTRRFVVPLWSAV